MGVRRRLLRELLASLKYIRNLTEQQISASLWRGEATLYNLVLEPRQLQQLFYDAFPVGLEILEATVKEVNIKIPWRQIMTQSIVVVAHNIEVRAVAHCDDDATWREVVATLQRNFLRTQLERIENAPHSLLSGPTGAFDQMRQRIADGMQIQVSSCSLSLLSCHPRHFPSHAPPEGNTRPLAETFRIVGEDITVSPCDPQQMPTDKLKAMGVYVSDERVLKISKFMKCRSLRILPGRSPNACPYAASEFMESPVVLTCHVCQKYPSDGSRICPFLIGNELAWEFGSLLGVTACECQVRAVMATMNDVSRLEEWRTNKELLENTSADAKTIWPDASRGTGGVMEPLVVGSQSMSDKVEEAGMDLNEQVDEILANTGFGCDDLLDLDDEEEDMRSCASEGSPFRSRCGTSPKGDLSKTISAPSLGSPSMIAAEPDDSSPPRCEAEDISAIEQLANTSGVSRTLARGSESSRKHEDKLHLRKRFEGLSSAADLFGFSRDNTTSSPPAPELDGEPLMNTSSVARTFARGPEQRRTHLAEHGSQANSSTSEPVGWKKVWNKRKADLKALSNSFRTHRDAASGQNNSRDSTDCPRVDSIVEECKDQEDEEVEVCDDGHESGNEEEEDEDVFCDAEDYFSVASGEMATEEGGASRSRWLKPIKRWLGSAKSMLTDTGAWPEMKQKKMVVSVCSIRTIIRVTAVESFDAAAPVGGFAELCLDRVSWRSEVRIDLPPPQLDCIQRLAHPADDRGIAKVAPRSIPAVGAWCLPVLQHSSQEMHWPVALLKFQGFSACDTYTDLLYSSGGGVDKQLSTQGMLKFKWKPREGPPMLVGSSPWVLRSWPIEICVSRSCIFADATSWNIVKASWERCKPSFSSKNPAPPLLPPLEASDSGQLFPVECFFVDFIDCEVVEAYQDRVILQERRWPMHVTLPSVTLRSNSNILDFSQVLANVKIGGNGDQDNMSSTGPAVSSSLVDESDIDVTIPKAMFDQLVKRSAEATLQHSQIKAAREELQKAYIMLAAARAGGSSSSTSHSSEHRTFASLGSLITSGGSTHVDSERLQMASVTDQSSSADACELERLRRKCAQLESSLQSQELAHRRLEAEFSSYQALARDELRQVLNSCAHNTISSSANTVTAPTSANLSAACETAGP